MKQRIRLASLLPLAFALALPVGIVRGQDNAPTPATAAPAARPHKPITELGRRMKRIAKAMKALHGQINDPSRNASSIELVAQVKAAAEEALTFKPEKEKSVPAGAQAAFQADYEKSMKQFIGSVSELSDALKANDNAKAAELYRHLRQLERKDHHKFRKPPPHRSPA
ncbi:MAG: cytochrome b562 [Opitutaceae bacterium]